MKVLIIRDYFWIYFLAFIVRNVFATSVKLTHPLKPLRLETNMNVFFRISRKKSCKSFSESIFDVASESGPKGYF